MCSAKQITMIRTERRKPIVQDGETLGLERTQSATGKSNMWKLVGLVEMMWLHQIPREVWSLRVPEPKMEN